MSVAILKFIGCLMGSQCRLERCRLAGPLDYPHLRLDRRIAVNQFLKKHTKRNANCTIRNSDNNNTVHHISQSANQSIYLSMNQ